MRGAAPRHRRGHERQPGSGRGAVRRLGRPARRRGHQAHRDHLPEPRREPGRELPEDDGRDGHGSAGHPDQARRPPPQHADPVGAAEAKADRQGPRDARDLRPARPPAGDSRDQVGARGPLLPAPAPAQVRRDQEARLPAARRARALRGRRRPVPEGRAEAGGHRGRDLRPRQALLLDLLEDDQEGSRVQRDLRPHRDARPRRLRQGLLRSDRDHPLDLEAAAGAVQGPDRDPEDEPLPGAAHHGDRPRGTAARDPDPHPGDARDGRVRDRRTRDLQGGRAPEGGSQQGEDDLAAAAARGRGRPEPNRVPRVAEGGPVRGRGVRVHAQGRGQEPLRRLDPARLRLCRPHRRRPPLRGREGERQDRPAPLPAQVRRHRRDPDGEAGAGARRGTGWRSCGPAGRATRSAPS